MSSRFIAEWEKQDGVILAFPHESTDWYDYLKEARECVAAIAAATAAYEKVYLLCQSKEETQGYFSDDKNIEYIICDFNDTWMRDCNVLACEEDGRIIYKGFEFTGWGGKFDAHLDNGLKDVLFEKGVYTNLTARDYILEGGAVESDGRGVILTTSSCLMNANRNPEHDKLSVEAVLKESLGAKKVLWLHHGHLAGDDTDGHIDTLARFCDSRTIAYVGLPSEDDEHYEGMREMKAELEAFRDLEGNPYELVALPFVPAMYDGEDRLPATYANFLIINEAVLVPTYGFSTDDEALSILGALFKDRKIIGVDCRVLVREHGSLHCMTMQLPQVTF